MTFWEFLVIVLVALLVLGPQRLYETALVLGRMTGRARRLYAEVRAELEQELQEDKERRNASSSESPR